MRTLVNKIFNVAKIKKTASLIPGSPKVICFLQTSNSGLKVMSEAAGVYSEGGEWHALTQPETVPGCQASCPPINTQNVRPPSVIFFSLILSILLIASSGDLLAVFHSLCLLARCFSISRESDWCLQ